jgi:hypothetical protein
VNWFKNLNAAPRSLLSFGLLIVLTGAISALAIVNLSRANNRMEVLYEDDMTGLKVADDLIVARFTPGEQARFAILNVGDESRAAMHEKVILVKASRY